MKKTGSFISILIATTIVLACSGGPDEFPAADFTLKSPQTGTETTFSAFKGKPVIIYWFTSW